MAALVVVVFVAASGGGVVYASQGALPGDTLYPVKLASEDVQETLTLSPEKKFAVQAEHAATRLEETQELMQRSGLDQAQREVRVRAAISGYETRLDAMDRIATAIAAEPDLSAKKREKVVQAAERVLDRHAALIASATATGPALDADVLGTIDDSSQIDDQGSASAAGSPQDDDQDHENARAMRRHLRQREQSLSDHLKAMRAGLMDEPLEIKAEN